MANWNKIIPRKPTWDSQRKLFLWQKAHQLDSVSSFQPQTIELKWLKLKQKIFNKKKEEKKAGHAPESCKLFLKMK